MKLIPGMQETAIVVKNQMVTITQYDNDRKGHSIHIPCALWNHIADIIRLKVIEYESKQAIFNIKKGDAK